MLRAIVVVLAFAGLAGAAEGFPQGVERPPIPGPETNEGVTPLKTGVVPAQQTGIQPGRTNPAAARDRMAQAQKDREDIAKLVDDALAAAGPANPSAEQKAAIEKLIGSFGAQDYKAREAASTEAVKLGTVALSLLREAATSADAETSNRARNAIMAIQVAALLPAVNNIVVRFGHGSLTVNEAMTARRVVLLKAQEEAGAQLKEAEAGGRQEEAGKLRVKIKEFQAQFEVLNALDARLPRGIPANF